MHQQQMDTALSKALQGGHAHTAVALMDAGARVASHVWRQLVHKGDIALAIQVSGLQSQQLR